MTSIVPCTVYGVILREPDGSETLDYGTLRCTELGARAAGTDWYKGASKVWREQNKPVSIRRFTLVEYQGEK